MLLPHATTLSLSFDALRLRFLRHYFTLLLLFSIDSVDALFADFRRLISLLRRCLFYFAFFAADYYR